MNMPAYGVIIVSGRDESILPNVVPVIEMGGLRPLAYLFKEQGSRELTADFKGDMVSQVLSLANATHVGFIDDTDSHMAAMIEASHGAKRSVFALTAWTDPVRGICLRPFSAITKHFVLLACSFGSCRRALLSTLGEHFGPSCRTIDFEDTSSHDEHWRHVLGEMFDAMSQPGVRLLFLKVIPNRNVIGS